MNSDYNKDIHDRFDGDDANGLNGLIVTVSGSVVILVLTNALGLNSNKES